MKVLGTEARAPRDLDDSSLPSPTFENTLQAARFPVGPSLCHRMLPYGAMRDSRNVGGGSRRV